MSVEAEPVFLAWLNSIYPNDRPCTETPADMDALVAGGKRVVRVTVVGGTGESIHTLTHPRLDFDCYAATRQAARSMAYDIRVRLRRDALGTTWAGAFIANIDSDTEPAWTPHVNTNLRRFTYSAQVRLHAVQ